MSERKDAVVQAVRDAKKRRSLEILSQISGISEKELQNIAQTGDVSFANEVALGAMLENAHGESMRAPFPATVGLASTHQHREAGTTQPAES